MTFDSEKCKFTINNATKIGTYGGYDAFSMILGPKSDGTGTYNTTLASVSVSGSVIADDKGNCTVAFVDNGSWSGYIAKAVYVRTFATNPPSGSAKATRVQLWYPTLYRAAK